MEYKQFPGDYQQHLHTFLGTEDKPSWQAARQVRMMGKPSRDQFKPAWDASQGACHDGTQPSRTPREVLRLLLLRTPTLTGGFSLPWEPRRYYSSSCSSWSKASAARRGAVSPLCAEILPFSAPLRLVGGVPLLLGPVDGRNISPLNIVMVCFLTFGGVILGIA